MYTILLLILAIAVFALIVRLISRRDREQTQEDQVPYTGTYSTTGMAVPPFTHTSQVSYTGRIQPIRTVSPHSGLLQPVMEDEDDDTALLAQAVVLNALTQDDDQTVQQTFVPGGGDSGDAGASDSWAPAEPEPQSDPDPDPDPEPENTSSDD